MTYTDDVVAAGTAQATIEKWLGQRWGRLCGASPMLDFKLAEHGAWVAGSTAWRACRGMPRRTDGDLDLVFTDRAAMLEVLKLVRAWGRSGDWPEWSDDYDGYYESSTCIRVRSQWTCDGSAPVLADLWCVPDGLTVEEHVLSFTVDHRRVAYSCAERRLFRGVRRGDPPGGGK